MTANSNLKVTPEAGSTNRRMHALEASTAADIIIGGIEKDQYRILVGRDARFMDLYSRVNPAAAARLSYRQMKGLLPSLSSSKTGRSPS